MIATAASPVRHDLNRVLYERFGGPRTDRNKLRRVPPEMLWGKVLDRRARDTFGSTSRQNPVIEDTLVALRSAGLEDPYEINPSALAHVERLLTHYNPKTDLEKAILIFRSVIPSTKSFEVAGIIYDGLSPHEGGLEIAFNDDRRLPLRIAHGSLLPQHLLSAPTGQRVALCLEFSFLLVVLLRAAGIKAETKDEKTHAYVIAQLSKEKYSLDAVYGLFTKTTKGPTSDSESLAMRYSNKGNVLQVQGDMEAALENYELALQHNPTHLSTLINKGAALRTLNRPVEAIDCYDQALQLSPNNAAALNNKGNALMDLGSLSEAIKCFDLALQYNPHHPSALLNRNDALAELENINRTRIASPNGQAVL